MKGKYLNRLIWLGCISVCIPVILISTVFYQLSANREKTKFFENNQSSVVLVQDRIERVLQGIEQESLKLALDPVIKGSFSIPNFKNDPFYHLEMLDIISFRKNMNPFIGDIIYYNHVNGVILSNEHGHIISNNYKYKGDIDALVNIEKLTQWIFLPQGRKSDYLSFVRRLPIMSQGSPSGFIIFNVKVDMLRDYLLFPDMSNNRSMFVVDSDGQIILHSKDVLMQGQSIESDPVVLGIFEKDVNSDQFIANDVQGEPELYTFNKTFIGRMYISVIPEREIAQQLSWIRWFTILMVLIFIAIGIVLTYFISKRAYNPLEQLVNYGKNLSVGRVITKGNDIAVIQECLDYLSKEAETLGKYMSKMEPALREHFLQRLLDNGSTGIHSLYAESEIYGIPIHRIYVILIIKIENFYKEKRFLPDDKPIATFAITNVMQELLDQQPLLTGCVFQDNEGNGVALLHFGQGTLKENRVLSTRNYANAIIESMREYLTFTVSAGIGRFYPHIVDVPVSYREAVLALQNRIYDDTNSVLYIEDFENSRKQSMFFYPRAMEAFIVESLAKGEMEQAKQALHEFSTIVSCAESYNLIYQSYHVLLSSIIHSLEKQGGGILDILEYNLFEQLRMRHSSKEIHDWFIDNLFPLHKRFTDENLNITGKSPIKRVCKYIREHADSDISLVQCADLVKVSPSYLSRLFKKEVGISFLEFVMECKVEEAKRLLLETDEKVSEIAAAVRYSERNLNRIFQRYAKMTPSQFRTTHR